MKLKIEKYKLLWNSYLEKFKISEFNDWFKAYLHVSAKVFFIALLSYLLFVVFTQKSASLIFENKEIKFLIATIILFIFFWIIGSAFAALQSVVYFRYIPKISITYILLYNAGLSIFVTNIVKNKLSPHITNPPYFYYSTLFLLYF